MTTVAEWCKPCYNETYCYEWDGCYGRWETATVNEFTTEINLVADQKFITFETDQLGYMQSLVPTFAPWSDALHLPDFVTIQARFRTVDVATKLTINDMFFIEVRGSDESFTDFCDYQDLFIEPGTNMVGRRVVDIVSDEQNTWEPEEFFITTEISGLNEYRMLYPDCASLISMSVEAKLPS
jgi:hypothetical protein